ncbi:MAG: hypothetical protein AAF901_13485, partial [Bacteroidota bacterium]
MYDRLLRLFQTNTFLWAGVFISAQSKPYSNFDSSLKIYQQKENKVFSLDSLMLSYHNENDINEYTRLYNQNLEENDLISFDALHNMVVGTEYGEFKLPSKSQYEGYYTYRGFLSKANSHIISYCSEGACETFALNNNENCVLYFDSNFDSGPLGIHISKDGKYLIYYGTHDHEDYTEYSSIR